MKKIYILFAILSIFSNIAKNQSEIIQDKAGLKDCNPFKIKTSTVPFLFRASIFDEKFIIPVTGEVTSLFGKRKGGRHTGIDIAASKGTPIKASSAGVVCYTGRICGYGLIIGIKHNNGFKTRYAHCSKIIVKLGDKIKSGQIIAKVGNTGRSTGSHLHFEIIRNKTFLNPLEFIPPLPRRRYLVFAKNS